MTLSDVDIWYAFNGFIAAVLICFPDEANYTIAPSPPFDSISSIRYSPTNPHQLLVSAWDAVSQFRINGQGSTNFLISYLSRL